MDLFVISILVVLELILYECAFSGL